MLLRLPAAAGSNRRMAGMDTLAMQFDLMQDCAMKILLAIISWLTLACFALAAEPNSCASLTELQCIKSSECTLSPVEINKYICRAATGKCELDFIQFENSKQSCETKQGCKYVPGNCYCPPDMLCRCGGGPPPKCVEQE